MTADIIDLAGRRTARRAGQAPVRVRRQPDRRWSGYCRICPAVTFPYDRWADAFRVAYVHASEMHPSLWAESLDSVADLFSLATVTPFPTSLPGVNRLPELPAILPLERV